MFNTAADFYFLRETHNAANPVGEVDLPLPIL
jgi:hypothetical protein